VVLEGFKTVEIAVKDIRAQYVRFTARSHGEWLFCDELIVR
jgi:hypothetical protein